MLILRSVLKAHRNRRLTKHLSASIFKRIGRLLFLLLCLVVINSTAMVVFEKMKTADAVWLSFTTLTTVGYGDFSPSTAIGRTVTIVTMYGFAITLLSLLAAEVVEWRLVKMEKKRKGLWEFNDMKEHIQIINTPNTGTERYMVGLIREIQTTPAFINMPVQLLTRKYPDGLPDSLKALKPIHRTGSAEDGQMLFNINLEKAKHIIILARDCGDSLSDSLTFDILSQVKKINPTANIICEVVVDSNRERFVCCGATAVLRPVRAYPEIIVRALSHPGTEQILEDLFDAEGDSIHKLPCQFKDKAWKEIVMHCMSNNIGTPLAYFSASKIVMHPQPNDLCTGDFLAVLLNPQCESNIPALNAGLQAA